ncbi:MAG: polysaccharide pyruvyl transferase family protein [Lachnospiraceae bacterium]|nr:polysaccharide pyruvyl transferase family protein [Lachnospiraceae bacterium]
MKAGILTFHEADNYGAVMQAYALQQTLKKLGADSEFVTIHSEKKEEPDEPAMPSSAAVFAKMLKKEGVKRSALFSQFRDEHLVSSSPYEKSDLKQCNDDYDVFIAGSDQIWNFRIPGADERYFLPFADPGKRFSYAASFGAEDLPEQAKPWCAKQLGEFKGLSVREKSGVKIIQELTGREAQVCLDPTLLLDRSDWELLIKEKPEEPYMLLFMLKYDPVLTDAAKKKAAESGLQLKSVTSSFMPQFGFGSWSSVGVKDWLTLIANAEGVFTNSFHGTVFSLLFGRPFHTAMLTGELGSRNGRIVELLTLAGVPEGQAEDLILIKTDNFENRISKAKESSISYLKEVVNYAETI